MSLMCSTLNGDDPGESTGIVTSRTAKALRSMSDAYPIPATSEPAVTTADFFRIEEADMHESLLPGGSCDPFHPRQRGRNHSVITAAVVEVESPEAAEVAVEGRGPAP